MPRAILIDIIQADSAWDAYKKVIRFYKEED